MSIQYTILLFYLAKASYLDWKKMIVSTRDFAVMWILMMSSGLFLQGIQVVLPGMLPGILLMLLTKVTHGAVGYGDGMALIICGMVLGARSASILLLTALLIQFPFALWKVAVGRVSGKTEMAFIPFILAAYLMLLRIYLI